MVKNFNPREAVRGLLQSSVPSCPIFLPIVFALGARIENVSLRNYLTNPTKISNALRQIRTHLRSDGVTCYFDPYLEAEALGGVLDWESDSRAPSLRWPQPSHDGELPEGLCSPEEIAKRGRIPIAVEVIRRLKPLVREDFLLAAGVTGPLTLAAQLAQLDLSKSRPAAPPNSALDLAAEAIPNVTRALVEAGANVIFIREELLPSSASAVVDWAARLATTINIVRFFEALPVLLLSPGKSAAADFESILRESWDAVVCAPMHSNLPANFSGSRTAAHGISLPASAFEAEEPAPAQLAAAVRQAISELRPALVTTSSDLSATADLKHLNAIAEEVNC
ncbi:MAG: uroporphyrinogen decarboxylase family protein [Candidatus Acidiferrales bacterium]